MDKETKQKYILDTVKQDILACDFLFGLLFTAANSYRHDTVLRPFPIIDDYVTSTTGDDDPVASTSSRRGTEVERDDHHKLVALLEGVPSLQKLQSHWNSLEPEVVNTLWWTLNPKKFTLKSLPKIAFTDIQKKTGQIFPTPSPNYIFEVIYENGVDARFQAKTKGESTVFAYHGSRVDNFHSILHFGLHSHMNKNGLFGEGTYLSSELSVSMPYAPTGSFWKKSLIGVKASLIAVCEIIPKYSGVKCQVKDTSNGQNHSSRSRAQGSLGGEIPEKYYLIQNNEAIRVKYVIVYADHVPSPKRFTESWMYKHRFLLMLVLYALLLVGIGLYNSQSFRSFMRRRLT